MTSSSPSGLAHWLYPAVVLRQVDWGDQLRSKWPYLAALGAGCLVGASGLLLAQRLGKRVEVVHSSATSSALSAETLSKELTTLHVTLKDLQEAVRELKEGGGGGEKGGAKPRK